MHGNQSHSEFVCGFWGLKGLVLSDYLTTKLTQLKQDLGFLLPGLLLTELRIYFNHMYEAKKKAVMDFVSFQVC